MKLTAFLKKIGFLSDDYIPIEKIEPSNIEYLTNEFYKHSNSVNAIMMNPRFQQVVDLCPIGKDIHACSYHLNVMMHCLNAIKRELLKSKDL